MKHVQAAGGVVIADDGSVCLVHRPRYDDWSLPKGKLHQGEAADEAARREVLEETGLECRLGEELRSVAYTDDKGRPKTVRFWTMAVVVDHGFEANDETDERVWVRPDAAEDRLSYEGERATLRSALERGGTPPGG